MTHETFVFAPAPPPTLAIAGSTARVPIHRIFCVGRNYADHAAEMGTQVEKAAPWYFTKSVQHALSNPDRAPMPKATKEYHYEVEWAVVLKSGGADITAKAALDHVLGHTVALDMTRRDLQADAKANRRPWDTGKDVEAGAIFGPIALTAQPDPETPLTLHKNGALVQSAPVSDMVWPLEAIIAHLSTLYTLHSGDVILTGTPAGVGPVTSGDRLVGRLGDLAQLDVTFYDASPASS